MRSLQHLAVMVLALSGLVSCNSNPNVAKQRYLASGDKYFERGKFRQAEIMYKKARLKDPLFGLAYYKLGLTELELKKPIDAVQAFRRALDLVDKKSPEYWNAAVKLSDIYLLATNESQYLDDVERYAKQMLANDPNSFDGHRLMADLNYKRATEANKKGQDEATAKLLEAALEEYHKADSLKPHQQGVQLQIARTVAAQKNFVAAEGMYQNVIASHKDSVEGYAELYRLLIIERKTDAAEQVLKQAYQNNPRQYAFLRQLALHYYVLQRRDDMLNTLAEIKAQAKDYPDAYRVVGDFYLGIGELDSAIKEFNEGISKDPKRKQVYQKHMIEAYLRGGKRTEAADLNAQVLKEDPNDPDARGLSATLLLDKGDINRALNELQALVTRAPDNAVARFNLGRAHAAKGEFELARQQYQRAVELRPDYVAARLKLAELQVTRGDYEAGLKSAQMVLAYDPNNMAAHLIESAALMGEKKYAESHRVLDALLKASPNSADVIFQLGVVNLAENKYKEAEEQFHRAFQLNPSNSRGLMGMVETDMAQNLSDQAIGILQTEANKTPGNLEYRVALGNIAVRAGKFDLAISEYQKLLDEFPKGSKQQGMVYMRIGETYRREGDFAHAVSALQQARQSLPDNIVALALLGLSLDSAGKWNEAQQVYEAVVKLDPANGAVLNNLAFSLAEHGGDLERALTMSQKAKQLMPTMPEVSDTLGWIYLKKNLADAAVDIFKDLVTHNPTVSTFHYHLGMAYAQKGDKLHATAELKEALKFNPTQQEKDRIQGTLSKL